MKEIRILLADDHPMFRFGIRSLLEIEPDMIVVGEASNGEEAVQLAIDLRPDVILMDLVMPEMDGVQATRQIVQVQPEIAVLIMTMLDDDSVFDAMRAGARGYLFKGASRDETLRAIRAVSEGEAIFSASAAQRLLDFFNPAPATHSEPLPELNHREREILDMIAHGLTNQEIAEQLNISVKTVRNRVSIIYAKLQVKSRSEAIIRARKSGLGLQ